MRLVVGLFAMFLTASVARADEAKAPEAKLETNRVKVPLRLVKVLAESRQVLLFDKTKGTHVLAEVGQTIDGYTVDDIDEDEVTLITASGKEIVLTAPVLAPEPAKKPTRTPAKVVPAPADPYAGPAADSPVDPYAEPAVRSVAAPSALPAILPALGAEGPTDPSRRRPPRRRQRRPQKVGPTSARSCPPAPRPRPLLGPRSRSPPPWSTIPTPSTTSLPRPRGRGPWLSPRPPSTRMRRPRP